MPGDGDGRELAGEEGVPRGGAVLLAVLLPLGTYRRLCLYLSPCAEEPICDPNDVAAEGEDPLGSRADLALTIGLREALYASNCMWDRGVTHLRSRHYILKTPDDPR